MRGPMHAICMPGYFCTKNPASSTKCMATILGRHPNTFWKVSLVSLRKSECRSSCHAGAFITTSVEAPFSRNTRAMSLLSRSISVSLKLRVCVDTRIWSSSVTTRPTLFDVSTVSFIVLLIFTTPCGICSSTVISASKAVRLITVAGASHFSMVHVMPASSGYSSRSHWFISSCCAFTISAPAPEGMVSTTSALDAIEALASPMSMDATSKSYSL